MKLLKKDLKTLLDSILERTEKFKTERFSKLFEIDNLPDKEHYWDLPILLEINAQYSQDIVLLMSEYKKAIEKSKEKAYHHAGYYQIFKGRNQYTKKFDH